MLCLFERIFVCLIHPFLLHLVKSQIIPEQHKFFEGLSSDTNLTTIVEYLQENLDRGIQVDVVYTDFSKAFDRTSIHRLINKLYAVGLCVNN